MIAIVDYGLGNLFSVEKAFKRLNVEAVLTRDKTVLEKASKLILPGVGHFGKGMKNLNEFGLREVLDELVLQEKKPVLGICLGMQLMMNASEESEESDEKGLGWIQAGCRLFNPQANQHMKVPHLGWNNVEQLNNSILFEDIDPGAQFYFAHSYHANDVKAENALTKTVYGGVEFVSSVQNENVFGVQFHPEKSHDQGLQLLKNFSNQRHV